MAVRKAIGDWFSSIWDRIGAPAGAGLWITAITAGANKLQLRLCQWGGRNLRTSKTA